MIVLSEANPVEGGAGRAIAAVITIAVVAGVAWWAAKASASTNPSAWVEKTPSDPLVKGTLYRVSMPPIAGANSDEGAAGFDTVATGLMVMDPPLPSDWPASDTDPTRWRYQFIASQSTLLTDWPPGMQLFAWE